MNGENPDLDGVDRMIEQNLAEADRMIEQGLAAPIAPGAPAGLGVRTDPKTGNTSRSLFGTLPMPGLRALANSAGDLMMTDEALKQTAAFVFYSPHVQTNPMYKTVAAATAFAPDMQNPEVNAFASHVEGAGKRPTPLIIVLGGAAAMAQVAALVIAADAISRSRGALLREFVKSMGKRLCHGRGHFNWGMVAETIEDMKLSSLAVRPEVGRKAQSYAVGMMAQVIGHELGHIALGHTLGTSANLEVSRNQEREADSFASSVLSTCPFGEYLVAGPVVWELIWVWCEHAGNRRIAATHPLSKERLMEFIRANKDESEAIGMCESTIREFMPPGS